MRHPRRPAEPSWVAEYACLREHADQLRAVTDGGGPFRFDCETCGVRFDLSRMPAEVRARLLAGRGRRDSAQSGRHGASAAPVPGCLAVLGLPASADERAVKQAFRRRSRVAHPDVGGNAESFIRLQTAYQAALRLVSARVSRTGARAVRPGQRTTA